jgi:hypothetical protein
MRANTLGIQTRACTLIVVAGAIGLLSGGCPATPTGSGPTALSGSATATWDDDPAGAADVINRKPGTVSRAESEGVWLCEVIDGDGGVHDFTILTNDDGTRYLAEYAYRSAATRLVIGADSSGRPVQISFSDLASGASAQLALQWLSATQALANMTTSTDPNTVAFDVTLPAGAGTAKFAADGNEPHVAPQKPHTRTEATAEQQLSLRVKIFYQDNSGNGVSGLRPTFTLRDQQSQAVLGVARGDEIGAPGNYRVMLPAYRYRGVSGDYPSWKPYFESGVYIVGAVTAIVGMVPAAPVWLVAGAGTIGFLSTTILPGVVDRVLGGDYSDVPYPTALGQQIEFFEVWARAGDRKNTTVFAPLTRDDLYDKYIVTGEFLDLGRVTVATSFVPKPKGYRLYLLPQIGRGQIEVLSESSESAFLPLCSFEGGGRDCNVPAVVQPMSAVFPTAEAAVRSICGQVSNLVVLPLGIGPAADVGGTSRFLSGEVYSILRGCP